jgi:hypothetical protein
VALTPSEIDLIQRLRLEKDRYNADDTRLLAYYRLKQRVEQLGMAIPPNMRQFLVMANWPRVVVDTIEHRQNVRSLILPGEETADPQLRAIWDNSNLDAHVKMFNRDRMIYGRAFMSAGANELSSTLPLVRVESPTEMAALIDYRHEVVTAAARFYGEDPLTNIGPTYVTLYQPNQTVWVERGDDGVWREVDRDVHNLGAVPVVMHLNRRMSSGWCGESELTDIIPFTDAAARTFTNLQFVIEAHGAPRKYMTGVEQGDFKNEDGTVSTQWEAYFDAIHMLTNPNAKVGQLPAADVANFEKAINIYGTQAAILTGFPGRYFGLHTTNPPAEGAMHADESQLNTSVEGQNTEVGMTLGWVGALALRIATGEWVEGNRVRVDWFDPATPTISQREDALAKRRAAGVLSREGYWDELGWTEARKAKERAYFEAEALDPVVQQILRATPAPAPAAPGAGSVA